MPRNAARYPDRLMPPLLTRGDWKARGKLLGDRGYDARWLRFWKAILDQLRDQQTWDDRDVRLLAEFVEWCRLAEDHQREAESEPYAMHPESGRRFAHPGFDKARDARVQAREVARELGLGPNGRAAAGLASGGAGRGDGGGGGDGGDQSGL